LNEEQKFNFNALAKKADKFAQTWNDYEKIDFE